MLAFYPFHGYATFVQWIAFNTCGLQISLIDLRPNKLFMNRGMGQKYHHSAINKVSVGGALVAHFVHSRSFTWRSAGCAFCPF